MQPEQTEKPIPDFGEPLDKETLISFASIGDLDIESALVWFDEHASVRWIGALEAPLVEE
jgi:hypothetical protein